MFRSKSHPKPPKFQLSDSEIFQKQCCHILASYLPIHKLIYYNSLTNGLPIALHECPKELDWRSLRGGNPLRPSPGSDDSRYDDEDGDEYDNEDVGVCGALGEIRRHWRHADEEVRRSFFIPGVLSRSGAKSDLAMSVRIARDEVKAAMEMAKGWFNADLMLTLDALAGRIEKDVVEPLRTSGHKDYYELTNKVDALGCDLRKQIQQANNARKEFLEFGKQECVDDRQAIHKTMMKHFDWQDVNDMLDRKA